MKEARPFAIALSADRNMELALHVALLSLLEHFESATVYPHFQLLLSGFEPRHVLKLRATLDQTGKRYELTVLEPDLKRFASLRGLHGNFMAYARLQLPDLLEFGRFLYVDADTLVAINVAPLYDENLQGHPVAVVVNGTLQHALEHRFFDRLGLDLKGPYFNSGFVLFDVAAWKREGILARCLEFGRAHPQELLSADQTILNVVLHRQVHALPLRYNRECYPEHVIERSGNEPALYHFVGSPKPWDLFGEFVHSGHDLWAVWAGKTVLGRGSFRKYIQPRNFRRSFHIKRSYWRSLKRRVLRK